MNAYILILIADVLMAVNFIFQKTYQKEAGTAIKAGLTYNAITGFFSAILFLFINGFKIKLTVFSCLMAAIFATAITFYTLIGFKIMEKGSMSLYTIFLMSGGMTVPYIFGVIFLNEELTILRTIGLAAIIVAIAISNIGKEKPDIKQLIFCIGVFMLNGISSVTSKVHQISAVSEVVTSTDFAFIVMSFKAIISLLFLLVNNKKIGIGREPKLPLKSTIWIMMLASLLDGLTYMLQLIGAISLPASVLYPLITGGTVILTAFAGMIVFKEKLSAKQSLTIIICFIGTLMFL